MTYHRFLLLLQLEVEIGGSDGPRESRGARSIARCRIAAEGGIRSAPWRGLAGEKVAGAIVAWRKVIRGRGLGG